MPSTAPIKIKPKQPRLVFYAVAFLIIILLGVLAGGLGYILERKALEGSKVQPQTGASIHPDWLLYQKEIFSLEYPKTWQAEQNQKEEPKGVKISTEAGLVNLWIDTARTHRFSVAQTKNIKSQKSSEIIIDKRKSLLTEYAYKDDSFFLTLEIPASTSPNAIFWVAANTQEIKKEALEIVNTFKSLVVGK